MGALTKLAEVLPQLRHAGQAFLDLANQPGTFKLPRDLGATPADIVRNASTPKLPMQLLMPHEVAAKNEYLAGHAFDAAKRHVDKMAANMAAKGNPMTAEDYAKRLDQAQAWNYAQHKNLQLLGNDENYLLTTPHGWAAIATPDLADPSRTVIEALNLNSAGAPGGGGANAYQALLELTRQQGLTNFTKELTPENTVRKPMNLMSHIARTGDTSHLELDPSFWGPSGLGVGTPSAEAFSQLSVPEQLGYLANVGKENAGYAMTQARYPHGLDTFMRDSAISPALVGRDYNAVDPAALRDLLGRTGPGSGVGDTALRQAILTHALNGQFDLMGSSTPAFKVERLPADFTQGIMYAEGGAVRSPHEGMTHTQPASSATEAPLSGLRQWAQHLAHRALHPFDQDVMAETAKNLKEQLGVGQPLRTVGEQDLSNALNFVNPVGGELRGLMSVLAVKPKGGNWFPMQLNDYIGNGVALGGGTHPAVKTWAETQLPRYIKTYLGTAEDPLLQVEKEGNLHIPDLSARIRNGDKEN